MMFLDSSLAITLPVYIYIALVLMKIVLVKMRQLQFILGINVQTFEIHCVPMNHDCISLFLRDN